MILGLFLLFLSTVRGGGGHHNGNSNFTVQNNNIMYLAQNLRQPIIYTLELVIFNLAKYDIVSLFLPLGKVRRGGGHHH